MVEASPAAVLDQEIPRLFYLRRDNDTVANGVQWTDGMVSVHWLDPAETVNWTSFDDPAAAIVHTDTVTVIWQRQDTYADTPG